MNINDRAISWYADANNKIMKYYDKNKDWSYWDEHKFYWWAMSHSLPIGGFEWVKDIPQFNENFTKNYTLQWS